MADSNEQLAEFNNSAVKTLFAFARVNMEGMERMLDLQLKAAKELVAILQQAKGVTAARDAAELARLTSGNTQPTLDKMHEYMKSAYEIAATTQSQLTQLVRDNFTGYNQGTLAFDTFLKGAPPGAEAAASAVQSVMSAATQAYENLAKAGQQFVQTAQANIEAAARNAGNINKKPGG